MSRSKSASPIAVASLHEIPSGLEVDPISPSFGAEVRGIDLRDRLTASAASSLRRLLSQREVLVFRDQILTPTEHLAFMSQFGGLAPSSPVIPGLSRSHHQVMVVEDRRPELRIASTWHSDITYMLEPPSVTSLFARILPLSGGDTEFASATLAYDSLSAPIKALIDTMSARHDDAGLSEDLRRNGPGIWEDRLVRSLDPVSHPMVLDYDITGRRSLFVNPLFTRSVEGLDRDESIALLDLLFSRLAKPEFTIRIRWEPGTMVLSENRTTVHRGVNDYGTQHRVLHKVSLRGERNSLSRRAQVGTSLDIAT